MQLRSMHRRARRAVRRGAPLRSEIGWLEAALSDAVAEHAAASETSSVEKAVLRSEIRRLEAALSGFVQRSGGWRLC